MFRIPRSHIVPLLMLSSACYYGPRGDDAPTQEGDDGPEETDGSRPGDEDGNGVEGDDEGDDEGSDGDSGGPVEPPAPDLQDCYLEEEWFFRMVDENCAVCHANGAVNGDFGNVTDLRGMLTDQRIVPGDAELSPVYSELAAGSMPPSGALEPDVVARVGQYIDECVVDVVPDCSETNEPLTIERQVELLADDIRDVDDVDRPNTRYLSLAHLHNAGFCGEQLDPFRDAMRYVVNGLSSEPRVLDFDEDSQVPGSFGTLYRLDITDVGWDVPVVAPTLVDGALVDVAFDDKWDALVASVPSAVSYEIGEDSDDLIEDTETLVPLLLVDSVIDTGYQPPLYHVMANIPNTISELETSLGIDRAQNIRDREVMRSGVRASGVSQNNRMIERHEIPLGIDRYLWISYDFANDAFDEQNLFASPFGPANPGLEFTDAVFQEAGGEAIFSLPNGFLGWMLFLAPDPVDGGGTRLDRGPVQIVTDPAMETKEIINGVSCPRCHTQILQIDDEVLPNVIADRTIVDQNVRDILEDIHPGHDEFREITRADTSVYRDAMARAGITLDQPIDALAGAFQYFIDDVSIAIAAGEIGITVDDLIRVTNAIQRLSQLREEGGFVARAVWKVSYPEVVEELGLGTPSQRLVDDGLLGTVVQ